MKLNQFLARQIPGFRQQTSLGTSGGRSTQLFYCGSFPLRPFQGEFTKHRLILVRAGSVVMERDGQTYMAGRGDALLVPMG